MRQPIRAYSANLLGSVAGIWIFAGLAFLHARPTYWFLLAIGLLVLVPPFSWRRSDRGGGDSWTLPFFAFRRCDYTGRPIKSSRLCPRATISTCSCQQYWIHEYRQPDAGISRRNPDVGAATGLQSSYDAPFRFAQSVDRVLVVGAGAGNDAAAALRNGAKHVDAVEIDPVILALGKRLHPEKPYSDPRSHADPERCSRIPASESREV